VSADFLEKAIEKAQIDQSRKTINNPVETTSSVNDFVYTQTRIVIPNNEILQDRRVVTLKQYNPTADLFRMLRTKLLKQLRTNNWNSFAITSPTAGVGKSMVAVNLAISMAMEVNQTVLLVDFDLRNPRINWYFDFEVEYGLLDYVNSGVALERILVNPGIERLVILPGREKNKGTSDIISAPSMKRLIEDIKSHYESRIIIFDMPPVLLVDDVLAAMEYYDAALLVVEDGANKPEELTKTLQALSNTNLLGIVFNKAENLPEHQGGY
jgi:capsular exopolysaccharide synthesis family protein